MINEGDYICYKQGNEKRYIKVKYISNNGSIKGTDKNKKLFWTHSNNVIKVKKAV